MILFSSNPSNKFKKLKLLQIFCGYVIYLTLILLSSGQIRKYILWLLISIQSNRFFSILVEIINHQPLNIAIYWNLNFLLNKHKSEQNMLIAVSKTRSMPMAVSSSTVDWGRWCGWSRSWVLLWRCMVV